MDDELEQPGNTQDSAIDDAGGENHNQTGDDHLNQDHSDDSDSEEQPEEEDEELEVGGKRIALPKSIAETLKSERLMQADYTRKTQEVAEDRKAAQAEREQVREQARVNQQFIAEIAELTVIDKQLAELKKIDLSQYVDDDSVGVQRVMLQIQQLESARNEAANKVTQKQQQFALDEQQSFARQVQEAGAYVAREIPNWSLERDSQLQKYVQTNGIPEKALAPLLVKHPALFKILDKAEKFDRLEKNRANKTAPTPPPAPVTRVTAAKPAAKSEANMSTAEWMAHREAQLRKKR